MDAVSRTDPRRTTPPWQRDAAGRPLIEHIRRVVAAVPRTHAVAWLHEVLEHTTISEQDLLAEDLSTEELRSGQAPEPGPIWSRSTRN